MGLEASFPVSIVSKRDVHLINNPAEGLKYHFITH